MNYEIVPSMKCFRCCYFYVDEKKFDSFCFLVGRDISDYIFDMPFDCVCFVSDDHFIPF